MLISQKQKYCVSFSKDPDGIPIHAEFSCVYNASQITHLGVSIHRGFMYQHSDGDLLACFSTLSLLQFGIKLDKFLIKKVEF